MIRTTPELVAGVIELDPTISDLTPFITAASLLVDIIDAESDLSTQRQQVVETWLAAHFYAVRDPRNLMERAGDVAATIESKVGMGFDVTRYGQQAMILDTSGILKELNLGRRVTVSARWLGTLEE